MRSRLPPIAGVTLAAVLLRLVLLLGRGDYLAFDEGWYLLLGRSLWMGQGYELIGTPHVTLSPLFPALAGAVGRAIGDWVWGGRFVAAVASGLVVLPVWSLVRRWSGERIALVVAVLLAVTPSMAPFVAAYWIGADLWVGAEPLLHLGLFAGLACWARASEDGGRRWWAATGLTLAAAFLARPEALGVLGLLGLWSAVSAWQRRSRAVALGTALMLATFVLVAAPYWFRLHTVTGTWRLTGREIDAASALRLADPGARSAATDIERMLLADDGAYATRLYSLDASGLRLQSEYWGVSQPVTPPTGASPVPPPTPTPAPTPLSAPEAAATADQSAPAIGTAIRVAATTLLPVWSWVLVLFGGLATMRRPRSVSERGATVALLGTSLTIGVVAAVDARTQLFLVPLLLLWMVRGLELTAGVVEARLTGIRPGFVRRVALVGVAAAGLGTLGWQLRMSLVVGSPHHVVGSQNREVAERLGGLLDGRPGPVASWHPAIAVFADRDWRPLPLAMLAPTVRFEQAAGAVAMVLSAYYPPTRGQELFGTRYTVIPVPQGPPVVADWTLQRVDADSLITRAVVVRPVAP